MREAIHGSALQILRVKNQRIVQRALQRMDSKETLDDLTVDDVFIRCLDAHQVLAAQRQDLLLDFQETVTALNDEDGLAE